MCSKYNNHFRLNNQHDWGAGAISPFSEHKNLHFDNEQDECSYGLNLDLCPSYTNFVLQINKYLDGH
jgi:hypothetical protein